MRRVTWFIAGFVVALVGGGYAKRRVRAAATQMAPTRVAQRAKGRLGSAVGTVKHRVTDAVSEGRAAMHAKEEALQPKS
jgi:hypothetical protein